MAKYLFNQFKFMKKNEYGGDRQPFPPLKKMLLMAKVTFILLFAGLLQVTANSYSQNARLTLNLRNVTISQLFEQIEEQSEFRFFYDNDLLDLEQKINVKENGERIEKILDDIFSGTNTSYEILDRHILIKSKPGNLKKPITQDNKITGTVSDQSGVPLPGVTVLVKGTTTGTVTSVDGTFVLPEIESNAVLVFSFVGMKSQELALDGKTHVSVTLEEESIGLDEVVAIGYGSMKRSDLTGSIGMVSSDELVSKGTTSVLAALQGTIPGVDITTSSVKPGGGFSIQIRGQNSIEDGEPLYVVDGVITNDINFLNPSDIEKVDILKDASSTAIYGSRGSNGVVIVQTKNAGSVKGSKMQVSYDGYFGLRRIAHTPEWMDGREWIEYRTSAHYSWDATNGVNILTEGNQGGVLRGSTIVNQNLYNEDYEDWLALGTQNGQQQNHYINISGSAKDISYNIGLGYQNEDGNLIQEYLDRYNLKISVNHTPSKYFQSGATANISQTTFDSGSQYGYRDMMRMPSILHAYDSDGNIIDQPGTAASLNGTGNFTSSPNPLLEIEAGTQENRRYDIIASFFAQLTPIDGLNIKTTISPRYNRTRIGSYYGVVQGNRSVDYASTENAESYDFTWDNQVSYNKLFGPHRLNATFIHSLYHTRFEEVNVAAENLPYKSYWYNIYSGTLVDEDCSSSYAETAMVSYAGRVNYDYNGKYLATATIRYDGSSKLAKKWKAFPSFALGWRASEEEFLQKDWLSNLKARFSFGYSGNNNGVRAYGTQVTPVTSSNIYYDYDGTVVSGFAPGTPVNQNLTWEKTREINLGADYGFFDGRISGTIDWYNKLSEGLLMSRSLTMESGVESMIDNIGSVRNKGIELSLNTINIKGENLYWSTSFTFAKNKNSIVSLYGKKEDVVGEARFIGEPINVIYDYKILGVWTQAEYDAGESVTGEYIAHAGEAKTLDASGDGELSSEDRVILGSSDPSWTGSFTSSLQYKNWDFGINIYTKQGVFLDDQFMRTYGYGGGRGRAKVKFDYYLPPNVPLPDWNNFQVDADGNATVQWGDSGEGHENSKYPIYSNSRGAYYGDNGYYQDASFVKVKNITLGYTFNKDLIKKIGMSKLRVYTNILNPFVFSDYLGWDPEYAATDLVDGNGPSNITVQSGVNVLF